MKIHVPIILAGLVWGGCSNNSNDSNNPNLNVVSTNSTCNLEKIIQSQKMPKDLNEISKYLNEKIIYLCDKKDFWNSPIKTINEGFGDCDDKAILGSYFAEKLGYCPKVLVLIENVKSGHLVTLLEEIHGNGENNKKYGAIESGETFYPTYDSIDTLVDNINMTNFRNYRYYSVIDLNSLDKDWRTSDKNLILPKKSREFKLISINNRERTDGYKVGKLNFEFK